VFGFVRQLHDVHDVQGPVDALVVGTGESVALLVAARGVQRCVAVPGGEVPAVGEAGDVTNVTEQPGRVGRADTLELLQPAAGGGDQFGQLRVGRLIFLSMIASSVTSSEASCRRVRPTM